MSKNKQQIYTTADFHMATIIPSKRPHVLSGASFKIEILGKAYPYKTIWTGKKATHQEAEKLIASWKYENYFSNAIKNKVSYGF